MPIINQSSYKPHFYFRNAHVNTILPALLRKVDDVEYKRQRIDTPDNDFIDLDFSCVGSSTIVVAVHGLESNTQRAYIKGVVKIVNQQGWDAVALNLRSCSGEPNLTYGSYHSGKTDDLDTAIHYIYERYNSILLIGFSLGGNIVLKYVGEKSDALLPKIKAAIGISTPCCLAGSSVELAKLKNFVYQQNFIRTLKQKAIYKQKRFFNSKAYLYKLKKIRTFYDLDSLYTAPAHGFKDANDYWEKCSSKQFLPYVAIPTLIINAADDPFLSESCYPYTEAEQNANVFLEVPCFGGHMGFAHSFHLSQTLWHEKRIVKFFKQNLQ